MSVYELKGTVDGKGESNNNQITINLTNGELKVIGCRVVGYYWAEWQFGQYYTHYRYIKVYNQELQSITFDTTLEVYYYY